MKMNDRKKTIAAYAVSIGIALAVGAVSALVNAGKMTNPELAQPPLSPPAWLFPVVWTILFTLMGISSTACYRQYTSSCQKRRRYSFLHSSFLQRFLFRILRNVFDFFHHAGFD